MWANHLAAECADLVSQGNPLREVRAGVSECIGLPERLTHVVR